MTLGSILNRIAHPLPELSRKMTAVATNYSSRHRRDRGELFYRTMRPSSADLILDLGSGDGSYVASLLPRAANVYIADIDREAVMRGSEHFGFHPIVLEDSQRLPFADNSFDIVFCSSTIEHVTVPKSQIWTVASGKEFSRLAKARQREFADEIRRVGKRYFVQTPNRRFPIESHTWLPGVAFLPRRVLCPLIRGFNRFWPKKTSPDWRLLGVRDMTTLFPDSTVLFEKSLGMKKSLIAAKVCPPQPDRKGIV
jgi:SAM-dependent methyltransferase